uniref:Uncharacterized protein n=1 Tax=Picea glauca TaxID=3330 RepID=A0A101M0T1_PICGL|nr:hypothetical protein ABT39_MTgene4131 [Picea glauca]QHR86009.1 hypothetical protein Q903MT_gene7 [Picea sitchensis]
MDEGPLTLWPSRQLLDPIPRPLAETPLRKKMSRRTPVSALCPPCMSTPLEKSVKVRLKDL